MRANGWLARARWTLLGLIVVLGVISVVSARFITDWLWFAHLGYQALFTQPIVWRLGIGAAAFLIAFLFIWVNLRIARDSLGRGLERFQEHVPDGFNRRWIGRALTLASILLAFLYGASIAQYWYEIAKGIHAAPFGAADPIFGNDFGFYIFTLPFLSIVQSFAMGLFVLSALIAASIYFLSGSFALEGWRLRLGGRPRVHLSLLLSGIAFLKAWDYVLAGYDVLYSTRGAVFGASYADIYASLPATRILAVIAGLVGLGILVNVFRNATRFIVAGLFALIVASILVGSVYPGVVQEYIVAPNELDKEIPFIENHIALTRYAFNLDIVEERDFSVDPGMDRRTIRENPWLAENIRLWDWRSLLDTYSQLQSLRPYYDFLDVDVDRYMIDGVYRQVMLSARELTSSKLQNQSWINVHMQYTHGYGVVMSPVNEVTPTGLPEFVIKDIPPRGGVEVTRPQIYYGEHAGDYVIVKSLRPEFDHPAENTNVTTVYEGTGGVRLSTFVHRLLFSVRFGTTRLFLSNDITSESRVMFYRNVDQRVRRLAPFLKYDSDPYMVVADGRLYWIIDAYTLSNRFPYARSMPGWGNYVRNSVKVVVDAYNGSVDFYVIEPEPIVETFERIFPGTFKPIAQMPDALRSHIRYPEDLFRVQAQVLARYHMTNPSVFYNQEDVWELPREVYEQRQVLMDPYYIIMQLPDSAQEEFVLMIPFTPVGKVNLIGWLAARNDGDKYGKMLLYTFSKQESLFGPMQFEARIDQDTDISTQLTLWGQQGSRVIRGNLFIIPVGDRLLYVEPLYLQAEQSSMPEFKRVIVGTSESLVMRASFAEALEAILAGEPPVIADEDEPGQAPVRRAEMVQDGSTQGLIARAADLFQQAQASAGAGDWEQYGRAMAELSDVLDALLTVASEPSPVN